jgi:hypothetical protein
MMDEKGLRKPPLSTPAEQMNGDTSKARFPAHVRSGNLSRSATPPKIINDPNGVATHDLTHDKPKLVPHAKLKREDFKKALSASGGLAGKVSAHVNLKNVRHNNYGIPIVITRLVEFCRTHKCNQAFIFSALELSINVIAFSWGNLQ